MVGIKFSRLYLAAAKDRHGRALGSDEIPKPFPCISANTISHQRGNTWLLSTDGNISAGSAAPSQEDFTCSRTFRAFVRYGIPASGNLPDFFYASFRIHS